MRVNRILTIVWGMNFGVALVCAWLVYQEASPHPYMFRGIVLTSFIAAGAVTRYFPRWYETHVYTPNPSVQVLSKEAA